MFAATQRLAKRLSIDPSTNSIRILSVTVSSPNEPVDVPTHEMDYEFWKVIRAESVPPELEDIVRRNPPAAWLLCDRSGRIRGTYDLRNETDSAKIIADLGMILPEFTPELTDEATTQWLSEKNDGRPETHLAQPPSILDYDWTVAVRDQQQAILDETNIVRNFQFSDRYQESGILFEPQIVDDQRWRLIVNHYDHGNGVCVADVDNDGKLDVYLVSQVGSNGLFRNLGGGKFENITEQSGVAVSDRLCVSASFCDIDNDGDADLFVTSILDGNVLFENDGTGSFRDVTEQSGLVYRGHSSGSIFFDYDRDGLADLFVANVGTFTSDERALLRIDRTSSLSSDTHIEYQVGFRDAFAGHLKKERTENSLLYRNLGGLKFQNVTTAVGLIDDNWSGDALAIDGNNDEWPDLYITNMQGHDAYYENDNGKRFVEKSREVFPRTPWGAMGIGQIDFDNDGQFEVFVTDMHSDMSADIGLEHEKLKSRMQWPDSFLHSEGRSIYGNAFLRRPDAHSRSFEDISDSVGAENYWPWGLSVGDLNADGFADAFLTSSMCFPYRYSANSVMLNSHGKRFLEAAFPLAVEPRRQGNRIKPWFELDADGTDKDHPMCAGRSGRVVVWSALGSRSSVMFDIDDDGDLDIITNEFNARPQVLISNLNQTLPTMKFLKVKLMGTASSSNALGAVVSVTTQERTTHQVNDGKSGYLSQSCQPLYFGLGTATEVKAVEVRWPTGRVQRLSGPVSVNQTIVITEDQLASTPASH